MCVFVCVCVDVCVCGDVCLHALCIGYQGVRDRCVEELREAAGLRLPPPVEMQFVEGSSMARYMVSRLSPGHHDSPEEQVAALPSLSRMTPEALAVLREKLLVTDSMSFNQYLRWLKR